MNNQDLISKLGALADNEAFIADLKSAESKNDLQNVLAKYGIDLTREETDVFASEIEKILTGREVSEAELEQVSGGVAAGWIIITQAIDWGKEIWKKCWSWGKKFANWEDKQRK